MSDITWTRGDTDDLGMTLKADGVPINLDIYSSISLCINSEKEPIDTTNQLCIIAGVPDADQVTNTGKIKFPMDGNEDNLGKYFYDIQVILVSNSKLKTLKKGDKFTFTQDINKATS